MNSTNRLRIHMGCGESLQSRRWLLRLAATHGGKVQRSAARRTPARQHGNRS